MSRPLLGKEPAENETVRLPGELRRRFLERCKMLGRNRADVHRKLIESWLRKTDEIARLKTKGQNRD